VPLLIEAAPNTSLRLVRLAKSTTVLSGSTASADLPPDVCSCTATSATRYARKLSELGVLVIVTTAVPLQPASASAAQMSHATPGTRRAARKTYGAFMVGLTLRAGQLFSDLRRF